jgi:glycosyltransferase involved in cell wall biosynthesis
MAQQAKTRGDAAPEAVFPDGVAARRIAYGDPALAPRISIIIPTRDGERRGLLGRLLDDLAQQSLPAFEVLLIIGDRRQGRAINRGVALARSDTIATMDDDTVVGPRDLLARLLEVLESDARIGIVGASTVVPEGSSPFQHAACRQIPRRAFPVQDEIVDSDMVQHPCLAMRRERFLAIGGEDEELIRGLDPLLRHKVRERGWRVVIAPRCWVGHPLPEGLGSVMRMYFRNGRGSAFAVRHFPERVLELDAGHRGDRFRAKRSLLARSLRHPLRWLGAAGRGHWIAAAAQLAYIAGYLREWIAGGEPSAG